MPTDNLGPVGFAKMTVKIMREEMKADAKIMREEMKADAKIMRTDSDNKFYTNLLFTAFTFALSTIKFYF